MASLAHQTDLFLLGRVLLALHQLTLHAGHMQDSCKTTGCLEQRPGRGRKCGLTETAQHTTSANLS